jgi:hypothetical protein
MSMMICDHAEKCGRLGRGAVCLALVDHKCELHGGNNEWYCSVIDANVRCIPHRNCDAEGRAARMEAVRLVRAASKQLKWATTNRALWKDAMFAKGIRDSALSILRAMREARKGYR